MQPAVNCGATAIAFWSVVAHLNAPSPLRPLRDQSGPTRGADIQTEMRTETGGTWTGCILMTSECELQHGSRGPSVG